MNERGATLVELLERAAAGAAGGVRLLDRREVETFLTWAEIRQRARAVAGGLQALGISPGERVALVYPTSQEFLAAFFGAVLAGIVPAPLYPPLRLGRMAEYQRQAARQIGVAGARLVLADRAVARLLGEAIANAGPELGCRTLAELPAAVPRPVAVGPQDLALLQFSSGTTVEPRPVALAHRAAVAQVRVLNALWPDTPEVTHSGVSWLPLYHDMGLIGFLLCAVERAATVTLLPPAAFAARPALWLRAISRYRATVSAAPDFGYALATARIADDELEGVDLSSWRVALDGAEPVSAAVLRAFAERFARWGFRPAALTPVYGLAEAALAVTFSELAEPFRAERFGRAPLAEQGRAVISTEDREGRELVSLGKALPGFALEVRDPAGRRLPEGRVGRLFVRGPSLFCGYLGQPERTAAALDAGGWLDTGDLGFLWAGELYLTGRAKDVLILRGRNHAPEEVEEAALRVAAVRAAAAVSHGREDGGSEALLVFAERRSSATAAAVAAIPRQVIAHVLAATGLAADRVEVLAPFTLPRTSSGKMRRAEALRLHLAGELHPPAPAAARALGEAPSRRVRRRGRSDGGEAPGGGGS